MVIFNNDDYSHCPTLCSYRENLPFPLPLHLRTDSYLSLLRICIRKKDLALAELIYSHLLYLGVQLHGLLGGFLVITLSKCGAVEEALCLSRKLPQRSVFSWTAIISAYADRGCGKEAVQVYGWMQEDAVEPNAFTFASLFKACGSVRDLAQGKKFHDDARRRGFISESFVASSLISMYGKCGNVGEAENVFCQLHCRDVVSWNAILTAHVEQGYGDRALLAYRQMEEEDSHPDYLTFVVLLQGCGILAERNQHLDCLTKQSLLEMGQGLHKSARERGFTSNVLVQNTLICMYGRMGNIATAEMVFNLVWSYSCTTETWNAMLSQYAKRGQPEKALLLFKGMHEEGMKLNRVTFICAVQACGNFVEGMNSKICFEFIQAFHKDAERKGWLSDVLVSNALLTLYGKCGSIADAEFYFESMPQRDIVSWNAMLSAYVNKEQDEKALSLYEQMIKNGIMFDTTSINCMLQSCRKRGCSLACNQINFVITSAGFDTSTSVASSLIQTYATCASMQDAQAVFDGLAKPDVTSWSVCIAGYSGEGNAVASICAFEMLKMVDIKPDRLVFASVLSSCTRSGLVSEGCHYFESMIRYFSLTPDAKHFESIVDLLGRAADFRRIENMLSSIPKQTELPCWLHLLSACFMHGNIELANHAFNSAVYLQPKQPIVYILMSMNNAKESMFHKLNYFETEDSSKDVIGI